MKKTFSDKTPRRGGSKNHAFGEISDRKKASFSGESRRPRRAFDDNERSERPSRKPFGADGGSRGPKRFERDGESRPERSVRANGRDGDRPFKRFDREDGDRPARSGGDRKPFGGRGADRPFKRFDREDGDRPARSGGDRKPFGGRGADRPFKRFDREDGDRPARSGGDRKPFGGRGAGRDGDRPFKRFDREDGERKPFGARAKGRDGDRPFKRFDREDGDRPSRGGPRKSFGDRKPFGGRSGDRGDFAPKKRSYDDKPRREKPAAQAADMPPVRGVYLWGLHAVQEAWVNPERRCFRLLVTEAAQDGLSQAFEKAKELGLARPDCKVVRREQIDALLPEGSVHQGVVLDATPLPELGMHELLAEDKAPEIVIVLDQVTDPHNVGAILRSAAAFGAGAVIVTERNAPQTTGVMAKVACGGLEHVPLVSVTNLARTLETLAEAGYWRVGMAEEGEGDLAGQELSGRKVALVLGAEGTGLRRLTRENCDALARLPTNPPIGSLNVSNAAAVALYETMRQVRAKKA